jgi:methyl-coenzyme M reductase subunit C
MILNAGSGIPPDAPKSAGHVLGAYFGLNEKEIAQISRHKVAVLHHGNVRSHVVAKARSILKDCDIPAVVVCQVPIDYEDFAREGVKTAYVMPQEQHIQTKGTVMAIVSGITRGQTPSREKIAEVIHAVMRLMKSSKLER